jgi:hypothetical protein
MEPYCDPSDKWPVRPSDSDAIRKSNQKVRVLWCLPQLGVYFTGPLMGSYIWLLFIGRELKRALKLLFHMTSRISSIVFQYWDFLKMKITCSSRIVAKVAWIMSAGSMDTPGTNCAKQFATHGVLHLLPRTSRAWWTLNCHKIVLKAATPDQRPCKLRAYVPLPRSTSPGSAMHPSQALASETSFSVFFLSCWKHMGIPILNAEQELSLDTCVLSPGAMFRDYGRQFLYCEVLSVDPSHIVFTCVLSGNVLY